MDLDRIDAIKGKAFLTALQVGKLLRITPVEFRFLHLAGCTPLSVIVHGKERWCRREILAWLNAGAPSLEIWQKIKEEKK